MKKNIVFLSSNEPIPTFRRKLELLNNQNKFNVYLIYWHRKKSLINMPMTLNLDQKHLIPIRLPDPLGTLSRRFFLNIFFMTKVLMKLFRIKPDCLHINNFDMFILFSWLKKIFPSLKLILDLIDTRVVFIQKPLALIGRVSLKNMDYAFITAPLYYDEFLQKIHPDLPSSSVVWVPNAPKRNDFADFQKLPHRNLTLGYFGYLRGSYSIQLLVDILDELNLNGLKISVLFAGIGIEKPLVKKFADKYAFVKYYGPFDYTNIKNLYTQVDLIYAVYLLDHNKKIHMSCRLSEAINCNLPIIVQAGSYQAEYVKENDIGYIVNHGKKKELKKLLKYLYKNRDDMEVKSINCKKILNEHQFEFYQNKILTVYKKILKN